MTAQSVKSCVPLEVLCAEQSSVGLWVCAALQSFEANSDTVSLSRQKVYHHPTDQASPRPESQKERR